MLLMSWMIYSYLSCWVLASNLLIFSIWGITCFFSWISIFYSSLKLLSCRIPWRLSDFWKYCLILEFRADYAPFPVDACFCCFCISSSGDISTKLLIFKSLYSCCTCSVNPLSALAPFSRPTTTTRDITYIINYDKLFITLLSPHNIIRIQIMSNNPEYLHRLRQTQQSVHNMRQSRLKTHTPPIGESADMMEESTNVNSTKYKEKQEEAKHALKSQFCIDQIQSVKQQIMLKSKEKTEFQHLRHNTNSMRLYPLKNEFIIMKQQIDLKLKHKKQLEA